VPLLALTLERTRNWSFDLSVSRGILAGSTALAATGAYLLVMASAGFFLRYVGGSWGRALEAVLVFAALLLLAVVSLSGTYRAKVRVFVSKHFFTYRYDYRQEWLRFTTTLTASTADQPWSACIKALGDLVESPGGGLWLRQISGEYRQVAHSSLEPSIALEGHDDPLPAFLRRTGWVLEMADVRVHPDRYEELQLPATIASLRDAWLIVPLKTANDLVGFVVLTPRVRIEIDGRCMTC
jgi:putative PEP-CTERM system histidine kinase